MPAYPCISSRFLRLRLIFRNRAFVTGCIRTKLFLPNIDTSAPTEKHALMYILSKYYHIIIIIINIVIQDIHVRFPVGADVTEFFDIAVADKSVVSCFFFHFGSKISLRAVRFEIPLDFWLVRAKNITENPINIRLSNILPQHSDRSRGMAMRDGLACTSA